MVETHVEITQSLPAAHPEAARIFYAAFRDKIEHLELFPRSPEQAMHILARSFCADRGFYALEQGKVIGVVGFEGRDGRRFVELTWTVLASEFGWFGASWRYAWIKVMHRFERPSANTLRVEALAVAESARGQGVGTLLLNRVLDHARKCSYGAVALEVVDTNPRARRLYERLGFVTLKTAWYSPITRRAGFTRVAYMRKTL
jgi:GNAT superfamily N-acetyltransferase